jgi:hypothetical protein
MVHYFKIFYILLLISCNNSTKPKIGKQVPDDRTIITKSDTFCLKDLSRFEKIQPQLIQACHIIPADTLSDYYQMLWRTRRLPAGYNSDGDHDNIKYIMHNDTLEFSVFQNVQDRNYRRIPDSIFWVKDTLCTHEGLVRVNNEPLFRDLMYEEVRYVFILNGKTPPKVIKHIWGLYK